MLWFSSNPGNLKVQGRVRTVYIYFVIRLIILGLCEQWRQPTPWVVHFLPVWHLNLSLLWAQSVEISLHSLNSKQWPLVKYVKNWQWWCWLHSCLQALADPMPLQVPMWWWAGDVLQVCCWRWQADSGADPGITGLAATPLKLWI